MSYDPFSDDDSSTAAPAATDTSAPTTQYDPFTDTHVDAAGKNVDKPESKSAVKESTLGDKALGVGEAGLSALTGGLANLTGGAGYLSALARGQGTDAALAYKNQLADALTYSPRTAEGKKDIDAVGNALGYMGEKQGTYYGPKVADATGSPALGAAVNTAFNIPQYLLGGEVGKGIADVAKSTVKTSLEKAQDLGYTVPPATSNPGLVTNTLGGIGGKRAIEQAHSIRNVENTNNLVRQELGLPAGADLDHDTLAQYRSAQSPAYEAVKAVPEIKLGPDYTKELDGITTTSDKIAQTFPNYKASGATQVQNLVDSLKSTSGKMDGETAVEMSKSLRAEASAHLASAQRTGDPAARALGTAYRDSATALENAIQTHLEKTGQPELADNWDTARRNIAKSYSVENALDGAGNVDARKLGKQLIKGKPLSGNLEAAAQFANDYPTINNPKWSKESSHGFSPLDVASGALGGVYESVATGGDLTHMALGAAALPAARMAARTLSTGKIGNVLGVPRNVTRPTVAASVTGLPGVSSQVRENDKN